MLVQYSRNPCSDAMSVRTSRALVSAEHELNYISCRQVIFDWAYDMGFRRVTELRAGNKSLVFSVTKEGIVARLIVRQKHDGRVHGFQKKRLTRRSCS